MGKKINLPGVPMKITGVAMVCLLIMGAGVAGMTQMARAKKTPVPEPTQKRQVSVATIPVVKEDIPIVVTGYGQVNPVRLYEISPRVSGTIIDKTSLKQGELVQKGDMLFLMDDTDYATTMEKAMINVSLQENQVKQLKVSLDRDKDRLVAVGQNTHLARSNYLRLDTLYKKNRVGTLSAVEAAQQSYNSLLDTQKTLSKSIDLYPLQIAEAQSNLADARSDLATARLDVRRCRITAPITGRIKEMSIETGAYITTGTRVLTLADDTILEIQVPLSDKDAFEVLGLRKVAPTALNPSSKDIECRVETLTGTVSAHQAADLHRVVKYDAATRTLTLAVRVRQEKKGQAAPSISLMDGMFCRVLFKGPSIKDAVKIPLEVLNPDNTVYLIRNRMLKTLAVNRVMEDNGHVYVSGSFVPEDQIIISKLSSPVENTVISDTGSPGPSTLAGLSPLGMASDTGEIK